MRQKAFEISEAGGHWRKDAIVRSDASNHNRTWISSCNVAVEFGIFTPAGDLEF